MKTIVEPLEGNRVKLSVEVGEQEFEKELEAAFRRIAREVRIPGFRPGKAPRRILEARMGADVARQEALREALPGYYAKAVSETEVDVIAAPDIDITSGQEDGPVAFDAVVEVRPKVAVPGYGSLRVTVPNPAASEEHVDEQVERLRAQSAELVAVARAARDGDHASIDIAGSVDGEPVEGLTADDYLYEVGSASVVPELDQQLRGAKVGDILVFEAARPGAEAADDDDPIRFRILVKEVKEQILPEVDDEWANEASEFETVEDLRADLRERLAAVRRVQSQLALRQGVLSALVELVEDDAPEPLVAEEVEGRARGLVQRLSAQGATVEEYLEATGTTAEQLTADMKAQAVEAVKADLALRAVVEAQGIEVDEDEVTAEIERIAERAGETAKSVRRQIERLEDLEPLRSGLKKGKALEWLVSHAEIVDEEGQPVDRSQLEPPPDPEEDPPPVAEDAVPEDPDPGEEPA
ncbi:MAG: trigger factor [Actinomycetota bacterium]|nr:trigger factor [Actinomycetota bacterium]